MPLPNSTQVRLETQLDALPVIIGNLRDAFLRKQPVADKWSILEHIGHLARYQEIFVQRLDMIMYQELPGIPPYRAEADIGWLIWQEADYTTIKRHLQDKRQEIIKQMAGYSPQQLKREGFHARLGSMDVLGWTEFFLLHEAHHLYTILQMRQEFFGQ